jgi:hypothetical protein
VKVGLLAEMALVGVTPAEMMLAGMARMEL